MTHKLYLVFLWHMHQPYYVDPMTGQSLLPWVRLHGLKDYYGMVAILREFPQIKATFNFVPSLIEQLQLVCEGKAADAFQMLGAKPPGQLEESERQWLLKNFFAGNYEMMIRPTPRWDELWKKMKAGAKFSSAEMCDLQVLFRLGWIDADEQQANAEVAALIAKRKGYSEDDKKILDLHERAILAKIIPEYLAAQERGQIEISASPYYHPILPLLIDSKVASLSDPPIHLPRERFNHPEDAATQVADAIAYHKTVFGRTPVGMWPPEGSVSEAACDVMAKHGIRWAASDEEVLAMSQAGKFFARDASEVAEEPERLYSIYEFGKLNLLFRDHRLSDLIGFTYSKMPPKEAADDFVRRLQSIGQQSWKRGCDPVVSVILDGENPWESYAANGRPFLRALYSEIQNRSWIVTETPAKLLDEETVKTRRLPYLHPGSWIDHNFKIWIGHAEDNVAWEQLAEARRSLCEWESRVPSGDREKQRTRSLAWKEISIAEGSDWFWWYGDDHSSPQDAIFDQLFRTHLMNVYHLIKRPSPAQLSVAIKGIARKRTKAELWQPHKPLSPAIDGRYSSYFEWLNAGGFKPTGFGSTMQSRGRTVQCVLFGPGDVPVLHLLIEWQAEFLQTIRESESVALHVLFAPGEAGVTVPLLANALHETEHFRCCTRKVTEASIVLPPGLAASGEVEFAIDVRQKGKFIERVPDMGYLRCDLRCQSVASA